jgi:hypothetical protein
VRIPEIDLRYEVLSIVFIKITAFCHNTQCNFVPVYHIGSCNAIERFDVRKCAKYKN